GAAIAGPRAGLAPGSGRVALPAAGACRGTAGSGLSLRGSREVTVHPAQPARPDQVVDERAGPVPLPGEPAPQLRLGRHDRRTHAGYDEILERAGGAGAGVAAGRADLVPAGQYARMLFPGTGGDLQ